VAPADKYWADPNTPENWVDPDDPALDDPDTVWYPKALPAVRARLLERRRELDKRIAELEAAIDADQLHSARRRTVQRNANVIDLAEWKKRGRS